MSGSLFGKYFISGKLFVRCRQVLNPPADPKTMLFNPPKPLIYLITSGATSVQTTPTTKDFSQLLRQVEAAVEARIELLQIREKEMRTNVLYQLVLDAAAITRGSATRLLVNDRADIASTAGADGVHLTTQSLPTEVVRRAFGPGFLLGVSTHSLEEATAASVEGADFVVFGPVFETSSKGQYGEPLGLDSLKRVASRLSPFPILALGGIDVANVTACMRAGARGIAAIRMLSDHSRLPRIVNDVREQFDKALS
jgi:thiamine-phosphate pyrophosphorylase